MKDVEGAQDEVTGGDKGRQRKLPNVAHIQAERRRVFARVGLEAPSFSPRDSTSP